MNQKKKLTDLLQDASFLHWLRAGRPSTNKTWQDWSKAAPENGALADEAQAVEQGIPFKEKSVPKELSTRNWDRIQERLNGEHKKRLIRLPTWAAAAAVVIFLSIAGLYWWSQQDAEWMTHQTTAGQTEIVQLSDGSLIHLAANSTLRYPKPLIQDSERSVYLEGEAYFEVQPQDEPVGFRVQTPAVAAIVLGTEFNVNAHRPQPIVSLTSGSLQVRHPDSGASKILEAGQTVAYQPEQQTFALLDAATVYWASWKEGEWVFGEGVAMSEVVQRIEETFGLKCVVEDVAILKRQPAGKVSIDDRTVLFESLEELLDLEFVVNGNEVRIRPAEN